MIKIGSNTRLKTSPEAAKQFWASKYTIGSLVFITTAVIAVTVYLSWISILDAISEGRHNVLNTLGLGIIPATLWIFCIILTATKKPKWITSKPKLWLSSPGIVILVIGIFSYFEPHDSILGWFTLGGRNTLGGHVGDAIIGSPTWVGSLRLSGIFVAMIAIAAPVFAKNVALFLSQGLIYTYIIAIITFRSLIQKQRSIRSKREVTVPPEIMTPYERSSYVKAGSGYEPASVEVTKPSQFILPESANQYDAPPDENLPVLSTSIGDTNDGAQQGEPPYKRNQFFSQTIETVPSDNSSDSPETSKFNRFWSVQDDLSADYTDTNSVGSTTSPIHETITQTSNAEFDPHRWQTPPMDLLFDTDENDIREEDVEETANTIRQTLGESGIEVEIGHVRPGPTVTMYGLVPGWIRKYKQTKQLDENGRPLLDESGKQISKRVESKTRVKVDSILAREKDLALALKTPSIRIETPAMGRSLVGIEVPNPKPSLVTLRAVMENPEFKKLTIKAHLPIALGKGSGGETVTFDLAKMPHLLIAGATGSGKSVCINAIVSCLIKEKSPSQMRLLLVDPKRVELTPYNGIPHLMTPVVVEADQVVRYLKGLIREMLERYRKMEEIGVRNIDSYNERMGNKMPFLVVAIDELADLMMTASFDVESSLCRLAQLGRATGIHLIVATQRPSVDVVTGLIKANFPSRISFGMTSQVDSRTILDSAGADKLLGKGDMLYLPLDAGKPSRVQSVFISDEEIEGLVNFWRSTPRVSIDDIDLLAYNDDTDESETAPGLDRDQMLDKAIELAYSHRKLSTSLIQRRLRVGYPRAARLMDQLEDEGIVGPGDGSKSRDVILNQA